MNTEKLISYFGKKSENLFIQSYWKEGAGQIAIEMNSVNINTQIGLKQFESMLNQVRYNGARSVCINGADFGIVEVLLKPELHKNQNVNYVEYKDLDSGIEVSGTKLIEGNIFKLKPDGKKYMFIKKLDDILYYQRWNMPFSDVYTRSVYKSYFTCLPF